MRVTFYGFDAGVWAKEAGNDEAEMELLEDLFDRLTIELQRVPCVGEGINLTRGNYAITATIKSVWTSWCEPNNPHIKPEYFGDDYNVSVCDVEIIEHYVKRR